MSLMLAATTDKFQFTTSSTAAVDVSVAFIDASSSTLVPSNGGKQNTAITTATTTDILAAPGASTLRTVTALYARNKGSASNDVTVVFDQNGTDFEIHKTTLQAGECLQYLPETGFVKLAAGVPIRNWSVAAQSPFSSDTYLSGSYVKFPVAPSVGTRYCLTFDVTKTAAGTATPIINVRVGTAGTTADTARNTFTFAAGTAVADNGQFIVETSFRTVGSGTSAVQQASARLVNNLTTTGLSNAVKHRVSTSAGFDSTVASLGIGASYNGGASAAHTIQLVRSTLEQ